MRNPDTLRHIDLDTRRQFYAEELRAVANLQSEVLVKAFVKVTREYFLALDPGGYVTLALRATGQRRTQIRNISITIFSWRLMQAVT